MAFRILSTVSGYEKPSIRRVVDSLFDIVRHNYSRDSMFLLLKTDLMPLTREAVDELETTYSSLVSTIINGNVKAGRIYGASMMAKMKRVIQMHRVELVSTKRANHYGYPIPMV